MVNSETLRTDGLRYKYQNTKIDGFLKNYCLLKYYRVGVRRPTLDKFINQYCLTIEYSNTLRTLVWFNSEMYCIYRYSIHPNQLIIELQKPSKALFRRIKNQSTWQPGSTYIHRKSICESYQYWLKINIAFQFVFSKSFKMHFYHP